MSDYAKKDAEMTSKLMQKYGTVDVNPDAKFVGFWGCSGPKSGGIAEVEAAKGELNNNECDAVLAFIAGSSVGTVYKGMAHCRACDTWLGSCDMVTPDKAFIFPDQYEHYVVDHGVLPPEPFITAALVWARK